MKNTIFSSWKTSLIGWGVGALTLLGAQAQAGHIDWQTWGVSIGLGLLGTLSKDFNVSGFGK